MRTKTPSEISGLLEEAESKFLSTREDSGTATKIDGNSTKEPEMVEVEEEWMGTKLKALTCYFGGLAVGQDNLFDS